MSSIYLSTYADLACANDCVYFGEKERETVKQRDIVEGEGGGFIDQG